MQSFGKLSVLILFLTFLLVNNNAILFMLTYQNTFIFDLLSSNVKQIILIGALFCIIISENSLIKQQINNFEYFLLVLSAVLGLLFLVSSYDMLSLYLAIEMQSLCLYVLAAAKKRFVFFYRSRVKIFYFRFFFFSFIIVWYIFFIWKYWNY